LPIARDFLPSIIGGDSACENLPGIPFYRHYRPRGENSRSWRTVDGHVFGMKFAFLKPILYPNPGGGHDPQNLMLGLVTEPALPSDRDLEHRVTHRLHDRNIIALRNIAVRADCGKVTLRGTVTSFYHKQLCIQACRAVPGVSGLIDEVEVDSIL
jgi:hypothetical protein